jgi:hypothetical protein
MISPALYQRASFPDAVPEQLVICGHYDDATKDHQVPEPKDQSHGLLCHVSRTLTFKAGLFLIAVVFFGVKKGSCRGFLFKSRFLGFVVLLILVHIMCL